MILQKLLRTFKAMFVGWVVFCISVPILATIVCAVEERSMSSVLGFWLAYSLYSIPVVLIAWLIILFPVDCLVPAKSKLREPWVAGLIGFIVGPLPFVILGTYQGATSFDAWLRTVGRYAQDADSLLYLGGAAITGLAAALHLAFKHPPNRKTLPINAPKP